MASQSQGAFVAYLTRVRPLVEGYLREIAPHATSASGADDLERYLYGPLWDFTRGGGKRTRPALCLLGAEAVGGNARDALPAAAAIETFQSAALIHDDIADEGELRRGKPCTYRTEGVGVAINVGDLGIVNTFRLLLDAPDLSDRVRLRLARELANMELRTVEGQALDLGWARDNRWDVGVDDYLYMASHKTAYYSGAVPLVMGAICGGGTDAQVEGLRSFGMDCGLAFQIQDDLLNLVGDDKAQGKDFRTDITEGKRTLVAVWSLAYLKGSEHDELLSLLSGETTDPAKLARAVELMERAGGVAHAREYARTLVRTAKSHLSNVDVLDEARATLLSMADFFVERLD